MGPTIGAGVLPLPLYPAGLGAGEGVDSADQTRIGRREVGCARGRSTGCVRGAERSLGACRVALEVFNDRRAVHDFVNVDVIRSGVGGTDGKLETFECAKGVAVRNSG